MLPVELEVYIMDSNYIFDWISRKPGFIPWCEKNHLFGILLSFKSKVLASNIKSWNESEKIPEITRSSIFFLSENQTYIYYNYNNFHPNIWNQHWK